MRAGLALLGVVALLAAGCGGSSDEDDAPPAASPAAASGELGPAEDTEITVAIPFPDVSMYSMYVLGTELGYYEEEGLKVKVITADNVSAAVASGSADIGVDSAGAAIEAVRNGIGTTILAGHWCRQNFDFAVQPDVSTVQDLDGKNIVLAGTPGDPAEIQRHRVLKEEGWDLDAVKTKVVYPGPDSATWREFFIAGRVSLMPFYGDDVPALEKHGAKVIVETLRNWANDVHLADPDWLKENPNSAVRFLRATMKANDFIVAPGVGQTPENKDKILDIYEANDFEVEDLRRDGDPWVLGAQLICENLYYDKEAWDTTIETEKLDPLDFDVDLSYLEQAQKLMDRDNAPPVEVSYP